MRGGFEGGIGKANFSLFLSLFFFAEPYVLTSTSEPICNKPCMLPYWSLDQWNLIARVTLVFSTLSFCLMFLLSLHYLLDPACRNNTMRFQLYSVNYYPHSHLPPSLSLFLFFLIIFVVYMSNDLFTWLHDQRQGSHSQSVVPRCCYSWQYP